MTLPLTTRYETTAFLLPRKEDLELCFSTITKAEPAAYMAEQFEERLKKAGVLAKSADALGIVKQFAHNVFLQTGGEVSGEEESVQSQADVWNGAEPRTPFQNLHFNLANEAAQTLDQVFQQGQVKMDMARNESDFLKYYSLNGKPLDAEYGSAMDKLFNAWLVENNMACDKGVIYPIDPNGKFDKETAKAIPIETFSQLIQDKEKGPEHFFSEKGGDVEVVQHRYPTAKKEAAKVVAPEVEAPKKGVEIPVAPSVEPEIGGGEGPTPV